jgi:hypothetical protein
MAYNTLKNIPLSLSPIYSRGNILYVDSALGNDTTGLRQRSDRPFLTLIAAQTAAQSGDLIQVYPGTYTDTSLGKNGVNWFFLPGALIRATVDTGAGVVRSLFSAAAGETFFVGGDGDFQINRTAGVGSETDVRVFSASGAGAEIVAEYIRAEATSTGTAGCPIYAEDGGIIKARGDYAFGKDRACFCTGANSLVEIRGNVGGISHSVDSAFGGVVKVWGNSDSGAPEVEEGSLYFYGNMVFSGPGNISPIDPVAFEIYGNVTCSAASAMSGNGMKFVGDIFHSGASNAVVFSGDCDFRGSIYCSNVNSACINNNSGTSSISGRFVAGASATESITGSGTLKVYNAFANKAVAGTVTQQIGTVTVDANVS